MMIVTAHILLAAALVALALASLVDVCLTLAIYIFVATNRGTQVILGREDRLTLPLIPPQAFQPHTSLAAATSVISFTTALCSLALLVPPVSFADA